MTNSFSSKSVRRNKMSLRVLALTLFTVLSLCGVSRVSFAETAAATRSDVAAQAADGQTLAPSKADAHGASVYAGADHGGGHGEEGGHHEGGTFDAHHGTWFNGIARTIFSEEAPKVKYENGEKHITNPESVKYDYVVIGYVIMGALALLATLAARKGRIRPEGKPASLTNSFEAMLEGLQNYVVSVMGRELGLKYTPLIASFFFCILFFNWMGLVPGMIAPTANPNTTIALAIVAFVATHFIAIREVGFKAWAMHFVGEPKWLFFLNIPLHVMGELVKPIALAIRLLCNVFGEEMVIAKLATMAVAAMVVLQLPIPFQFPIMVLGVLLGFLQALVFSTLLAIYISTMSTHHEAHDEHNDHGHVEHVNIDGRHEVIGHPTQATPA